MFRAKFFDTASRRRFLKIQRLPRQQQEFSTSPFPFRAGYGLGSWIPPNVYHGMVKEGILRSKVAMLDQVITDLESTLRELELENTSLDDEKFMSQQVSEKDMQDLKDQIGHAWTEKVNALKELFTEQTDAVNRIKSAQASETSAYEAGATSPIKWDESTITYTPRSSESMTIDAHFFTHENTNQDIRKTAKDVSKAAVGHVKAGVGNMAGHVASAVQDKQEKAMASQKIESTLLLVAKATHANVMQFKHPVFDEMLLKEAWNHYNQDKNENQLSVESLGPNDLTPNPNEKDDGIHMISECFLGSCFIGMVHFAKNESESRSGLSDAEAKKMGVQFSLWLSAITGDTDISNNFAKAAADAASNLGLDLRFDLMSLGYCPSVTSNTLETTIESFKSFDPANFKLEGSDSTAESEKGSIVKDEEERAQGRREALRQSNMKAVIQATIKGVQDKHDHHWKVLDLTTFMNAFDDYTKNAKDAKGGIPIGINVRSWYRHQIAVLLWKKYLGAVPEEKAQTGQQSASAPPKTPQAAGST